MKLMLELYHYNPRIVEYLMKSDNFDKVKKAMDAKSQSTRTKSDIDNYNKATNEMNSAVAVYNKNNTEFYNNRSKLINDWNDTVKSFMDKHVPSY